MSFNYQYQEREYAERLSNVVPRTLARNYMQAIRTGAQFTGEAAALTSDAVSVQQTGRAKNPQQAINGTAGNARIYRQ